MKLGTNIECCLDMIICVNEYMNTKAITRVTVRTPLVSCSSQPSGVTRQCRVTWLCRFKLMLSRLKASLSRS